MKWWEKSRPCDIQPIPWLSEPAVDFFERLLKPTDEVLEYGAGGSTLWLADRVQHVLSIEYDPDWYAAVREKVPDRVKLLLWFTPGILPKPVEVGRFDVIFIDGPLPDRPLYMYHAVKNLISKNGGWIVLDNCNHKEFDEQRLRIQHASKYYVTFTDRMAGTYAVTEFYRIAHRE